jgi:hypothetical protein
MPSASPPLPPHYTPATAAHSWGSFHQHHPAAMYDTSDPHSHQDYASTDHFVLPASFTFSSSPAQQVVPPTTRYPSPMSRHPPWAYPSHTQWQSAHSLVDARASSIEPSTAHKVWLLECKHCETFLTNRGMKVRIDRCLVQRPVIPKAALLPRLFYYFARTSRCTLQTHFPSTVQPILQSRHQ